MFSPGILLFFLIPGLLFYCGLYGLFHSGKTIAPEPPGANTIEAITVVLLSAAVIHAVTALGVSLNEALCERVICIVSVPLQSVDPYVLASQASKGQQFTHGGVIALLGAALLQGIVAYISVRLWLFRRAKQDRLPPWIYGWATDIANSGDNEEDLIIAYVLSKVEHGTKPIIYVGILYDMALRSDGTICRITLWDCERYTGDFDAEVDKPTLPKAMSKFPFMMINSDNIQNVSFEVIPLLAKA